MDKIFVENLVLIGKHGVTDRERAAQQEFHIDISAEADTRAAAGTDQISDTANYKNFAESARQIIEGPSCKLIETLAHKIAELILEDPKVKAVSVTIRKPKALSAGIPGITIVRSRQYMTDVYLALGSNLGNRARNLRTALAKLSPGVFVEAVSPVYETKPKYFENQPRFLNVACKGHTELGAREVFKLAKNIERDLGREEKERFGPRIIDIDILFYGMKHIEEPGLTVPHPSLHERAFVLVPLSDIAPAYTHPLLGITIKDLLAKLGDTSAVVQKARISI